MLVDRLGFEEEAALALAAPGLLGWDFANPALRSRGCKILLSKSSSRGTSSSSGSSGSSRSSSSSSCGGSSSSRGSSRSRSMSQSW